MRQRVAKIHEEPITEILRDMALIAGDDLGAGLLIGPYHLTQVFRVEVAREDGGIHQVTEQHGELAAFGFWWVRSWCRDCCLGSRLLLGRTGRKRLTGQGRTACPAEFEARWIVKATLRTQVLESRTTLTTELHPAGVVKAAV